MSVQTGRRRWVKVGGLIVGVYLAAWLVTFVFGPQAARREAQHRYESNFAQHGWDPKGNILELRNITVPAPFVVNAEWKSVSLDVDGKPSGSGTAGDSTTLWILGWTQIVSHRDLVIFCGV